MEQIKLNSNVYIKKVGDVGYIANLSNDKQYVLNNTAMSWISLITDQYQDFQFVLHRIRDLYKGKDATDLEHDVRDLFDQLFSSGFLCMLDEKTSPFVDSPIVLKEKAPDISNLTIEVTNRCNERCVHCYLPDGLKNHGTNMQFGHILKLVDRFKEIGGTKVSLTGGEIFVYPKILEVVDYIRAKGLDVVLYSNLISLKDEQITHLKNAGISKIQTTLYGFSDQTHDGITKIKGSFQKTVSAIKKLVSKEICVTVAYSLLRSNRHEVFDTLQFTRMIGITLELELYINAREDHSTDNLIHRLSAHEMKDFLIHLAKYDKEFTRELIYRSKIKYDEKFDYIDYLKSPVCNAGWGGLYIRADGGIAVCPVFQEVVVGNCNKEDIKEIWENSSFLHQLRSVREFKLLKCVKCEYSDYCSRCFARNYTETSDYMMAPRYACDIAKVMKEVADTYL